MCILCVINVNLSLQFYIFLFYDVFNLICYIFYVYKIVVTVLRCFYIYYVKKLFIILKSYKKKLTFTKQKARIWWSHHLGISKNRYGVVIIIIITISINIIFRVDECTRNQCVSEMFCVNPGTSSAVTLWKPILAASGCIFFLTRSLTGNGADRTVSGNWWRTKIVLQYLNCMKKPFEVLFYR